jgi:hypothetical protein
MVWLALRLVTAQRQLGDARVAERILEGKRVLAVGDAQRAFAERDAAMEAKVEALRQADERDVVIHELQDLLDECRDPVVVRARLADLLSGRPRLPH